jgi:hypothetical protein
MNNSKMMIGYLVSVISSSLMAVPAVPATAAKPSTKAAPATPSMTTLYRDRCANCHGDKANGVPKLKVTKDIPVEDMAGAGVASGKENKVFGSPLNHLTKEELVTKLINLRAEDHEASVATATMRENLKKIEKRYGKILDEKMAEYIYETFGPGSK